MAMFITLALLICMIISKFHLTYSLLFEGTERNCLCWVYNCNYEIAHRLKRLIGWGCHSVLHGYHLGASHLTEPNDIMSRMCTIRPQTSKCSTAHFLYVLSYFASLRYRKVTLNVNICLKHCSSDLHL